MKLKELPVNAVIESLSEEDKKIYLPGILFSGIVDTEMNSPKSTTQVNAMSVRI